METGLEITVCHFPPGTSKWNKVEHRLFSHITMNWRGRPLTSHEVVVNTIAATTTRTGLRVRAELDAGTYETGRPGQRRADGRTAAGPPRLARRLELHPPPRAATTTPALAGQASPPIRSTSPAPDLAWLCHPALTGLPAAGVGRPDRHPDDACMTSSARPAWTSAAATGPVKAGPGTGRRPVLTLADRLLAAVLHYRLGLPQVAIAALFGVRPETVSKRIRDIRQLLDQAGYAIQPGPHRLANLEDLYDLARSTDIAIQPKIKTAC